MLYIPNIGYIRTEPNLKRELAKEDIERLSLLRLSLGKLQDAISLPQLVALLCIGVEPGLSVNDLAERMGIPQQTASRYASVLLGRYDAPAASATGQPKEPLITQGVSERDPRSRTLHLTPAGQQVLVALASALNSKRERNVNVRS